MFFYNLEHNKSGYLWLVLSPFLKVKKLEGGEGQKCGTSISDLQYIVSAYISNFTGQAFSYSHRLSHIFHLVHCHLLSDGRSCFVEPLQELEIHLHHYSLIVLYHPVLKHLDHEAGLHLVVKSRKCGALPPSLWVFMVWYFSTGKILC